MTYPTNIPLRPDCAKDTDNGPCRRYQGHFGDCMGPKPLPDWAKNTLGLLEFDRD